MITDVLTGIAGFGLKPGLLRTIGLGMGIGMEDSGRDRRVIDDEENRIVVVESGRSRKRICELDGRSLRYIREAKLIHQGLGIVEVGVDLCA
jgi:hypothetical protein